MSFLLQSSDYKKVLAFASSIQANQKNPLQHLLISLKESFGYHYLSLLVNDSLFQAKTIFCLHHAIIEELPNDFSDCFFLNNHNLFDRTIICSIDEFIPYHAYKNTDYNHRFLEKNQLSHHLFLPLKAGNKGIAVLGIHKTREDDDFTAREKQIFLSAHDLINASLAKTFEIKKLKSSNSLLKQSLHTMSVGILVLDSQYSLLYCNEKAKEYKFDLTTLRQLLQEQIATKNRPDHQEFDLSYQPFLLKIKTVYNSMKKEGYLISIYPQNEQKQTAIFDTCLQLGLSKREAEIIELILNGDSNDAIAKKLFVSINTVKTHIKNIFNKLGVNNRTAIMNKVKQS